MSRMKAEVTLDTQDPAKTPEDSLKGSKGLGSFGRLGANLPGCLKISERKKTLAPNGGGRLTDHGLGSGRPQAWEVQEVVSEHAHAING